MARKPTYEELRQKVRDLKKEATKRKRAEQGLQESEERYRTLFELAADSIVLIDGETEELVEFNKKAHENLGFNHEEFKKLKIPDFEVVESAEEVAKHIEKIIKEGSDSFETKHRTKSGEIRDIQVSSRAISILGKAFIQSIWRDITARKRAEVALRESEELFRNVYDTAPLAFVVWDLDARVTDWNRKAEEVFGWSKEEALGRNFFDFLIPEKDRLHVERVVDRLVKGELPSHSINDNLTKHGKIITCEWNNSPLHDDEGNIVGAISLALDITERKQAEEALCEGEATLKSIFRAAPTGIGMVSDRILKRVNDRICEMTGYSREELVEQNARVLYPTDEDFEYVGREKYAQIRERGTGTVETHWKRKDGKVIDVLLSSTPVDPSDLTAGVTFTALDITERKQAEEALRKAHHELERFNLELEEKVQERTKELKQKNKQLVEAERLAALGKMANRVAHELRNPLTAIGGFARRINENTPAGDPNKKYLQVIVENVITIESKVSEITRIQSQ